MKKILTLFAVVGLIVFSSCEGPIKGLREDDALMPEVFEVKNVNLTKVTTYNYKFSANFSSLLFDDEMCFNL